MSSSIRDSTGATTTQRTMDSDARTIQRTLARSGASWVPLVLASVMLALIPPYALGPFYLNLLGKFLTYAIVALGLDLIWGYTGMLSLGQGLFFGLGGYAMAMYLKLEACGKRLPDFMEWSGRTTLPAFWIPFHSPVFAIAAALIVPSVVAGVVGYLIFRSRVQGVYFAIITQALTLIANILFIGQQPVTGGTNGITDLSTIFGRPLEAHGTQVALYEVTAISMALVYVLCRAITNSRFGRLLVAMRDDEARIRFLGYNPVTFKVAVFVLSAAIAGLAGALFVPQVGIISPDMMDVVFSVEIVIWVAVGGRNTLVGAILGAILVNAGKSAFSDSFPDIWQYFLGGLFIASVLLFPNGLVGSYRTLLQRFQSWRRRGESPVV